MSIVGDLFEEKSYFFKKLFNFVLFQSKFLAFVAKLWYTVFTMKNERQGQILQILRESGYASTAKLAKLLYTSLPTVRRDLIALENAGYVVRSHGGATLPPSATSVAPIDFRRISHRAEKQVLCAFAQKYLKDYQTVFLDDSTTVLPLVKYLVPLKNVVVVTNSVDIAAELRAYDIEFYCTGGKCILHNNLVGRFAEECIKSFNFDVCFFSSSGISKDGRIMDVNEHKCGVVQAMLSRAKQKIYLCDESKIDALTKFNIAKAEEVDLVITTAKEGSLELSTDKVAYIRA